MEAASVGRDKLEVSHLQYVDDTIFAVKGSLVNAIAIKRLLILFEVISRLKANFEKSCVFAVNVENEVLMEMANILGCKVGVWPILYLGLSVGGRSNTVTGLRHGRERSIK